MISDRNYGFIIGLALMLSMFAIQYTTFQDTSFLVAYYKGVKGVSGAFYGIISIGQALGSLTAFLLNNFFVKPVLVGKYNVELMSTKKVVLVCLVISFVWANIMSFTPRINNPNTLITIVFVLKYFYGINHFIYLINCGQAIETWLPGKVFLGNALIIGAAHAVGQSMAASIGSFIYLRYGVNPCYWICAEILLLSVVTCYFVLPDSEDHPYIPLMDVPEPALDTKDVGVYILYPESTKDLHTTKLSPSLSLLVIALVLIQIVPGFVFITLLPHLEECCDLQLSKTAHYLYLYYLASGGGYVISGVIAQGQYLRLHSQAILGALLCLLCLIITYPANNLESWYENSHNVAYLSIFLVAVGDPQLSSNSKKHMEEVHIKTFHRPLSISQRNILGDMWLICTSTCYHIGSFLGAVLTHIFGRHVASLIISSSVVLIVVIMIFFIILERYSNK